MLGASMFKTQKQRGPRHDRFTPERPPRYGNAHKLWAWWIRHTGQPPDELRVNRPSQSNQEAGAARYTLRVKLKSYLVWNVEETLQITPAEAQEMVIGTYDYGLR